MARARPLAPVVPIGGRGGSVNSPGRRASSEPLSCGGCVAGGLDPYTEHCEFPDRWRAYLTAHFGSRADLVAAAFGVTDRAARKWLAGETGCRGGAVAIAVQLHPETAPQMLWAAE